LIAFAASTMVVVDALVVAAVAVLMVSLFPWQ
jgi:hypothetical protein